MAKVVDVPEQNAQALICCKGAMVKLKLMQETLVFKEVNVLPILEAVYEELRKLQDCLARKGETK